MQILHLTYLKFNQLPSELILLQESIKTFIVIQFCILIFIATTSSVKITREFFTHDIDFFPKCLILNLLFSLKHLTSVHDCFELQTKITEMAIETTLTSNWGGHLTGLKVLVDWSSWWQHWRLGNEDSILYSELLRFSCFVMLICTFPIKVIGDLLLFEYFSKHLVLNLLLPLYFGHVYHPLLLEFWLKLIIASFFVYVY